MTTIMIMTIMLMLMKTILTRIRFVFLCTVLFFLFWTHHNSVQWTLHAKTWSTSVISKMDIMSIDDNCNDVSLDTRMLRNNTVLAQRYLHLHLQCYTDRTQNVEKQYWCKSQALKTSQLQQLAEEHYCCKLDHVFNLPNLSSCGIKLLRQMESAM